MNIKECGKRPVIKVDEIRAKFWCIRRPNVLKVVQDCRKITRTSSK